VNEQDEKDFEEYAFKMGIPPWHKYPHKITWLEGRRTLREKLLLEHQDKHCLGLSDFILGEGGYNG